MIALGFKGYAVVYRSGQKRGPRRFAYHREASTSQNTTPHDVIAHHEASHFVIGALFEIQITAIQMRPDANYEAAVAAPGILKWIRTDPQRSAQAAMFRLAGPSGEKKFIGRTDNSIVGHGLNDLRHADTILAAVPTRTIVAQRKHELIKQGVTDSGRNTHYWEVEPYSPCVPAEENVLG